MIRRGVHGTVQHPMPRRDSGDAARHHRVSPSSVEWTFFVATLVLLVGPIVAERFRLPGIVGVVLGGLLVGPFVLDWIQRDGIVESLGDLGLLYLMFLAGLSSTSTSSNAIADPR